MIELHKHTVKQHNFMNNKMLRVFYFFTSTRVLISQFCQIIYVSNRENPIFTRYVKFVNLQTFIPRENISLYSMHCLPQEKEYVCGQGHVIYHLVQETSLMDV